MRYLYKNDYQGGLIFLTSSSPIDTWEYDGPTGQVSNKSQYVTYVWSGSTFQPQEYSMRNLGIGKFNGVTVTWQSPNGSIFLEYEWNSQRRQYQHNNEILNWKWNVTSTGEHSLMSERGNQFGEWKVMKKFNGVGVVSYFANFFELEKKKNHKIK